MKIPLRVLIIEDSEDDKDLILLQLKRGGYEPEYRRVETNEALINALETQTWDIILSDFVMPNFDGLSALDIVKSKDIDIPFILISGTIGESVAVNAMRLGAHDYLMKDNLNRLNPAIERELKEYKIRRQRKQAIDDLTQSELRYKQLFDNDLTGDFIVSVDGTFLLCNKAMAKIFGFNSIDEIMNCKISQLYKNYNDRIKLLDLVRKNKIVENYETEYLRFDGKVISVIENIIGNFDENGELVTLTGYMFDITESKSAEKPLKIFFHFQIAIFLHFCVL